ncbi:ROK family transcriptional regulator [Oscillospiraceae bacterium PP1C4]
MRTTLNAAEMKNSNRRRVLEIIRQQPISRAELARETGLTRATISVIVDALIQECILIEGDTVCGKIGRKSTNLQLNPHAFYAAGINLARGSCTVGLVNFCGEILVVRQVEISGASHAQEILDKIDLQLKELLNCNVTGQFLGIGITAPGPLDCVKGEFSNPPNFTMWKGIPIVRYFEEKLGCKVLLENNANALALAEKSYGLGGDYGSFLELVVDTGIGGGFILKGNLYKGAMGFGNEFGHTTVDIHGEQCGCGNYGCAELYASIPNIVAYAKAKDASLTQWETIVNHAIQGEAVAQEVLLREASYLATVIVNAVNVLDVQAVVLAGTISYRAEVLNEQIHHLVNSRMMVRSLKSVTILPSQLSQHAPVLSSANLILEQYLKTAEY